MRFPELEAELHRQLLAESVDVPTDRDARRALIVARVRSCAPLLSDDDLDAVVAAIDARLVGLGPVTPLFADPAITDIMMNGAGPIWVERSGRLERTDIEIDLATLEHMVERIVGPLGRRVDRTSPMVDARLADGSRVNAVVPPAAIDGPYVTIRRFGVAAVGLEEFGEPALVSWLARAVRQRANIVVSGGTGAGKTTLLNALAAELSVTERVVTIEDAAELRLPGDHIVRLEAQPAQGVTIRDLVRNALRMRPDRIIVGEVRGGEALDMLQAMNTGHDGSLSTCHANSPIDALRRIETMVLIDDAALPLPAVRDQIDSAVDLVVQVARADDGRRAIVEVAEVTGGGQRVEPAAIAGGPWACRRG
ncbi:MAG: CpaF family protein [Acidimicrobiia bacterium]|nr:CpaF family protein [Acidimicrobiia bacterium]